jgi:crotonobetainyl-CoA:carnitine CoA-transferase CaiB-like acyl-CoA transferase
MGLTAESGEPIARHGECLSGVRVVDFADESGAFCGKLLADLGADVIVAEPPGGSRLRSLGPFFGAEAGSERSLFFWYYGAGKRSVVVEPGDPVRLGRLLAAADVAVVTGTPAQLAARGLTPLALCAAYPGLIVATISPFGLDGPRCDWLSSDLVAQAAGGMVFVNGHPDEPPLRGSGLPAYHAAGLQAAMGVVLALLARGAGATGQVVDVSLQEAVLSVLEHVSAAYWHEGRVEQRRGTMHWTRTFRAARCRDGWALLSSAGDWTTLAEWVKSASPFAKGGSRGICANESVSRSPLAPLFQRGEAEPIAALGDSLWEDFTHRREHAERLFDLLDVWAAPQRVEELVAAAQLRRLPFAAVRTLPELVAHPQLRARGFFVPVMHPQLGRDVVHPAAPFRFAARVRGPQRPPPRIGEHTGEVLAEIAASPRRVPARGRSGAPNGGALAGVRVLDFTWVVAGPAATRILADHGADVIKIERPGAGDYGGRRSGLTGNLNRGKRSVVIDISRPRGLELVRALVPHCDVVIDNFSSRVMDNWNLDYEALRALRPDVIAVRLSGFGRSGPWQHRVSYGPTLQAECGYTWCMRHPGGAPAGWGFSFSDTISGCTAALAVLAALRHRAETGEGAYIDVAQLEALAVQLGPPLLTAALGGGDAMVIGNDSAERPACPHGVYRCRDDGRPGGEWCAISVFDDAEWRRCAGAIGRADLGERYPTLESRTAHRAEIERVLSQWTAQRSPRELVEVLQRAAVHAGVVADARDLCEGDEHLRRRGYWQRVETPEGAAVMLDGPAPRLSATPGAIRRPAPLLGEHTAEVLREILALEQSEIERLRVDGAIV